MSRFIPNSFQVPNAVVDELIADMSEAELKCFLLVIRKTTGWNKEMDSISISQFMALLKLSKGSVVSGCDRLIEKGLLIKTTGYRGINVYSINWSKIQTSPNSELVKNLDITSQNFRQDLVKNLDTQNTTIQNTTIQNNTPLNPPKGEKPARKRSVSVEKFNAEKIDLPEWVNRESWIAYCQMRKAKGKPIRTKQTLALCLRELEKHSQANPQRAVEVLEQSIANCWTGLFALQNAHQRNSGKAQKPNAHSGFEQKNYEPSDKWEQFPAWLFDSEEERQQAIAEHQAELKRKGGENA